MHSFTATTHFKSSRFFVSLCIFPLLARDSVLPQSNKVTIYKLLIQSILTYAALSAAPHAPTTTLRLQVIHSKCLRVIGNRPRRTSTSHLHKSLNIQPTHVIIHRLTATFFSHCPLQPNPQTNKYGIILKPTCLTCTGNTNTNVRSIYCYN